MFPFETSCVAVLDTDTDHFRSPPEAGQNFCLPFKHQFSNKVESSVRSRIALDIQPVPGHSNFQVQLGTSVVLNPWYKISTVLNFQGFFTKFRFCVASVSWWSRRRSANLGFLYFCPPFKHQFSKQSGGKHPIEVGLGFVRNERAYLEESSLQNIPSSLFLWNRTNCSVSIQMWS